MADAPFTGPEKLGRHYELNAFTCGVESLDQWLKRFAYTNQQSDRTTTYVVRRKNKVVGYYSLTAGSVNRRTLRCVSPGVRPTILWASCCSHALLFMNLKREWALAVHC
jgi:hypothetical protein